MTCITALELSDDPGCSLGVYTAAAGYHRACAKTRRMAQDEPLPPPTQFGYSETLVTFFVPNILFAIPGELLEEIPRTRAKDQQRKRAEGCLSCGNAGKTGWDRNPQEHVEFIPVSSIPRKKVQFSLMSMLIVCYFKNYSLQLLADFTVEKAKTRCWAIWLSINITGPRALARRSMGSKPSWVGWVNTLPQITDGLA